MSATSDPIEKAFSQAGHRRTFNELRVKTERESRRRKQLIERLIQHRREQRRRYQG